VQQEIKEKDDEFRHKVKNWDKNYIKTHEDHMNYVKEMLKVAARRMNNSIEVSELLLYLRLYSVYQFGDSKFYSKLNNLLIYKSSKMTPSEIVQVFEYISLISTNKAIDVDFTKLLNLASYRLLKALHSLSQKEIGHVVYSFGKTTIASRRLLNSYKKVIEKKIFEFDANSSHKIILGWINSK
jgi:hypothetical protein